jgi:hypothetical protein
MNQGAGNTIDEGLVVCGQKNDWPHVLNMTLPIATFS